MGLNVYLTSDVKFNFRFLAHTPERKECGRVPLQLYIVFYDITMCRKQITYLLVFFSFRFFFSSVHVPLIQSFNNLCIVFGACR